MTAGMIARYLANKPSGMPEVYLIAAAVVFALSFGLSAFAAATNKNGNFIWFYRVFVAFGLGCLALAFVTH
jgi:4-amino-4-deoxy-L-arabinose transferase-like glycosyltransferase